MEYYTDESTIIACSTGTVSNSAIGLVRASGCSVLVDLNEFFNIELTSLKPRYATYCHIKYDGHVFDDVVVTYFKGPHSYNGDDILEVSVHGNQINIRTIIELIISNSNARAAQPGEFSYRAYRNKKLNISQVEGLDLLLNASSIFELDQGQSLLSGKLKKSFENLLASYLDHKSAVEFGFDFLEDMGEENFKNQFKDTLNELEKSINSLFDRVQNSNKNIVSPEVCLYGLPNSGKSSLFNLLLNDDRAIVSNLAGTTRDYIQETLFIENNIFKLVDTAGIRETKDFLEEVGVGKALEIANDSFFKILVVNPLNFSKIYADMIKDIRFDQIIFTHIDQPGFESALQEAQSQLSLWSGPIEPMKDGPIEPRKDGPIEPKKDGPIEPKKDGPIEPRKDGPIEPRKDGPIEPKNDGPIEPRKDGPIEPIYVNLLESSRGELELIKENIYSKYTDLLSVDPILVTRHTESIVKIHDSISLYVELVKKESDMAIISSELNIVGHCISELIGIISPDDVLNNIFENFCIGK